MISPNSLRLSPVVISLGRAAASWSPLIARSALSASPKAPASATISGLRRSISLVRTASPMNSNAPPRCRVASSRSIAFISTRAPAHRSSVAAGVSKLHVEPVLGKVPGGARNLVRHAAQQLTTIGKLDLLPLRLGGGGPCRRNDARDQRRALEHRAPRHVSLWHAGRSFVAAAHANLRTSQRRQSINLCQEPEVPAVVAATVT